jgi:hypothetical protein
MVYETFTYIATEHTAGAPLLLSDRKTSKAIRRENSVPRHN